MASLRRSIEFALSTRRRTRSDRRCEEIVKTMAHFVANRCHTPISPHAWRLTWRGTIPSSRKPCCEEIRARFEHGRDSGCLRPAVTGVHERRDPHPLGHRAGRPAGGRGAPAARLRRAPAARRSRGSPRRSRGRRSRPRPWSTRPTSGSSTARRPSGGTAAATSSPRRPRRCAASSSRTPAASGPRSTAAGWSGRTSTTSTSRPRPPPRTSWPSTRPSTKLEAEDPVKAQLVKLRYFAGLTEEEAASVLGISRATAQRHWRYAKVWLLGELRGSRRLPKKIPEIRRAPEASGPRFLALPYRGRQAATGASPMQQAAPNVEEIFFAALELESPEARSAFLDQGLRRHRSCGDASSGSSPLDARGERLPRGPGLDAHGDRRPRFPLGRRGARHGHRPLQAAGGRSARAAWASSTWPSRPSRSAARWR